MMVEQPQDRRTRSYRAVVLDYGMVLCHRPTAQEIDRIAGLFGITHAAFWTSYERNRILYDRGDLTPAEYWFRFAECTSCPIEENTIERLQKWDIEMWSSMDARMLNWTKQLRAAGYKTAILSNLHLRFVEHLRKNAEWLQNFDCQIFSSEVRLAKPDPAIFQFCLQNLEMNGRDVLIVDDRHVNIEAARQEGLAAICFHSVDVLRADLNKIDFDVLP